MIKERLTLLSPGDPNSYYEKLDIVHHHVSQNSRKAKSSSPTASFEAGRRNRLSSPSSILEDRLWKRSRRKPF